MYLLSFENFRTSFTSLVPRPLLFLGEEPGDEAIVLCTYKKYIGHQVHTFTNIYHWCSMYFFIYAHVKRVGLGDLVHMH